MDEIEGGLRAHLDRFLGVDEVDALRAAWKADDADGLVDSVVSDAADVVHLTWVLQDLVRDGLPVRDWRTLVQTIAAAGGLERPGGELRRALRGALQPHPEGESLVVPPELEAALLGRAPAGVPVDVRLAPRHAFRVWLQHRIGEDGPVTLTVETDEARAIVDALVRLEHPRPATIVVREAVRA
jgi:hypothetical protein